MTEKINALCQIIKSSVDCFDPAEEFGIDRENYADAIGRLDSMLGSMVSKGDLSGFEYNDYADEDENAEELYFESCLSSPGHEVIFERHGWKNVKDFFSEIPALKEHEGYLLMFRVDSSKGDKTLFATTVLGMCMNGADIRLKTGCTVTDSKDGFNHFWLVKYTDSV